MASFSAASSADAARGEEKAPTSARALVAARKRARRRAAFIEVLPSGGCPGTMERTRPGAPRLLLPACRPLAVAGGGRRAARRGSVVNPEVGCQEGPSVA